MEHREKEGNGLINSVTARAHALGVREAALIVTGTVTPKTFMHFATKEGRDRWICLCRSLIGDILSQA